ncbi:MAG: adenylate kinase family protein [Candidatus Aenigmarchaeota archaeon]|nr:adenylate kinase family protein [Candidatus Aenigmarchaeota archaeon]
MMANKLETASLCSDKLKIIAISGSPGVGKSTIAKALAKKLGAHVISISELVKKRKLGSLDRKRQTRIVDIKDLQKAVENEITKFHKSVRLSLASRCSVIIASLHSDKIKKDLVIIIEGHMAHLLDVKRIRYIHRSETDDITTAESFYIRIPSVKISGMLDFKKISSPCSVIILRCDPFVLEKRLKKRGWTARKIKENILAEMLDIIPAELAEKISSPCSAIIQNVCQIDVTNLSKEQAVDQIIKYLKNPRSYKQRRYNWLLRYSKRIKEFEFK